MYNILARSIAVLRPSIIRHARNYSQQVNPPVSDKIKLLQEQNNILKETLEVHKKKLEFSENVTTGVAVGGILGCLVWIGGMAAVTVLGK